MHQVILPSIDGHVSDIVFIGEQNPGLDFISSLARVFIGLPVVIPFIALAIMPTRGVGTVLGAHTRGLCAFINISTSFPIRQKPTKREIVNIPTSIICLNCLLVSLITVAVKACECIDALMPATVHLHFGAFIHVTMQWLIRLVRTIRYLVADQMIVNALAVRALEFTGWARRVGLIAIDLVRMIPAIVLAIATILITDTLEVLTSKFVGGACLVTGITHLSLIRTIATIIIVVAEPTLVSDKSSLKNWQVSTLPPIQVW